MNLIRLIPHGNSIDNLLQELTHEYGMTTVINTHDMNSLVQITGIYLLKMVQWHGVSKFWCLNLIIRIYKILFFHLTYIKQLKNLIRE